MENDGIFYDHLEYFTVIWYILWQFGNVVIILYIFPRFGIFCQEKSGNPEENRIRETLKQNHFEPRNFASLDLTVFFSRVSLSDSSATRCSPTYWAIY
jgi:hypothetical protein